MKIMTGIAENSARCNRLIARPALEVAQERLAEVEQDVASRSGADHEGYLVGFIAKDDPGDSE